jgi:hypothetical protein
VAADNHAVCTCILLVGFALYRAALEHNNMVSVWRHSRNPSKDYFKLIMSD